MEAPVTTTTFPSISMATLVSRGRRQVKFLAISHQPSGKPRFSAVSDQKDRTAILVYLMADG
jgi:hypothetical protein